MISTLRTALVVAVALLLAGCGGSGSTAASSASGSSSASSSAAPTGDEQKAIDSLASTFVADSTGSFGLTQDQANCVAQGFVSTFRRAGTDRHGRARREPGARQQQHLTDADPQPGVPLPRTRCLPACRARTSSAG